MAEGTGRFDPDNEQLRRSLAWHAEITKDLQGRVLKARRYVTAQIGDPELLAILDGHRTAGTTDTEGQD